METYILVSVRINQ